MGANIITVCCSLSYMLICSMCYVSMVRLCYVSIFSLCSVSIFSMCYVSMHASLASLGGSSLRSLRPLRGRCGRFAAAAAASRPQAITPNIIVFIVRGLTFVNVSALGHNSTSSEGLKPFGPLKAVGRNSRMCHQHAFVV